MPRKQLMAQKLTKQELLESEYQELFTRDPETFFEAMLISLRSNTMQPLDSRRMDFQKVIFKNWFRVYDRELRKELAHDIAAIHDAYKGGKSIGEIHVLSNIPTKWGLFGRRLDKKAVKRWLSELQD